jgi:four helix bundle protein
MRVEKPHKKLDVWKLTMKLCKEVYSVCNELPQDERYGLTSQMKRSAISIASNIAEGAARNSRKEFIQCLSISQGSLAELDTQLELCSDYLNLIEHTKLTSIFYDLEHISKMITGLKKSLRTDKQ